MCPSKCLRNSLQETTSYSIHPSVPTRPHWTPLRAKWYPPSVPSLQLYIVKFIHSYFCNRTPAAFTKRYLGLQPHKVVNRANTDDILLLRNDNDSFIPPSRLTSALAFLPLLYLPGWLASRRNVFAWILISSSLESLGNSAVCKRCYSAHLGHRSLNN